MRIYNSQFKVWFSLFYEFILNTGYAGILAHASSTLILFDTETEHQLHAKKVVHGLDLSKYDGIVCVSGDGILVEVRCNG